MNDFFQQIYSWFMNTSLESFQIMLPFTDDEEGVLIMSGAFGGVGITCAAISIALAVAFYIWPINHPRFKSWWSWLIMLALNAAINFGLAFAFLNHRINDIQKAENEVLEMFAGEEASEITISSSAWMDFALANVGVSILFFAFASIILTWFSTNARLSPFRA